MRKKMSEVRPSPFNVVLTNNYFRIVESSKPNDRKALSILKKIEKIIKERLSYDPLVEDPYSGHNYEKLAPILVENALKIRKNYLAMFAGKKFSQVDQVRATSKRIFYMVYPARTLDFPVEITLLILSFLAISDLARFATLNREGKCLAYEEMSKRSIGYGYSKKVSINEISLNKLNYLKNLFLQLRCFCRRYESTVEKYYSYQLVKRKKGAKDRKKINYERSLINLKSMSHHDLIHIFSDQNYYFNLFNLLGRFLLKFNDLPSLAIPFFLDRSSGTFILPDENSEELSKLIDECSEALLHASQYNNKSIVHFLLKSGFTPDIDGVFLNIPYTPLQLAAREGHLEIFEILLTYNANINLASILTSETALHLACQGDTEAHVAIAKKLLELGADPHRADYKSNSAYIYAEKKGYQNMMRLFSNKASRSF